ncbi:MAG: response regulator transcription factor [Candidatus Eisenbacteria bacterium]|uniref:Response regulator transcription factor n=1 Tax=Eiseniibacteriota bacterium TaxID=2212470 RepID=A0A948W657_UNCEI|nr:response regulator transcription factor [Candidatus Eisenbacteria bacterium]MBU1950495.1 response regulator transcription factor [Candidatus Eisenbacteria bacterium]MBU2691164.1 response regulator transcription factor [Candidatus Eisenbacteria bacterium]
MKILVVDDDMTLRGLIAYALRQEGYLALEASDGIMALKMMDEEAPDLIILDLNMPKMSGFDVIRKIREDESTTPILVLSVRSDESDQIRGLDLGADDYLTKPFSPRTLVARVGALLRRAGRERPGALQSGEIELDIESQSVRVSGGNPVHLTHLESRLLHLLVANAERPLSAERITGHVWGYSGQGDRQLLKQLVRRLRQKVESDPAQPRYIITAPGIGYILRGKGGDPPPS